jgi:hypothetical protein
VIAPNTEGTNTMQPQGTKLGAEVRPSLSLLAMTGLTLLASIGFGVFVGRVG